jgi:hypothetical protein
MTSHTVSSAPTTRSTSERRVARLFGLSGDSWMRHANPWSVWTRFAVLPLLTLAIWTRDWIGWWSLVPIALSIVFMMINPLLFKEARSTRNWASKAVFGERIWSDRNDVDIPAKYRGSKVFALTYTVQFLGLAVLAYGLVRLDVLATLTGMVLCQTAKGWYLDRMVLMFEDMKERYAEYAKWEY